MKSRYLVVVATLCTFGLLVTSGLSAQDKPADQGAVEGDTKAAESDEIAKVKTLLSGFDYFPTKDELDSVSSRTPEILVSLYEDPDSNPGLRGRCIDALGYYESAVTDEYLRQLLANVDSIPNSHVHKALTAHSKAFGVESLDVLETYLAHSDKQLRITASVAIAKNVGVAGREVLSRRLEIEIDDAVKRRLSKDLARVPARP